jgi:hypothetical protein
VTRLTGLEIFTNPNDLEIMIGQDSHSGKFAMSVSRGPGHNFKPLLTSTPFAETFEGAVDAVKEVLAGIEQAISKEWTGDRSAVLTADLIVLVVEELRRNKKASTYTILANAH